jgi:cellulose synthase/poly-beta-1,6-N-acetylglucosamine synthase-like glycosyltransferase
VEEEIGWANGKTIAEDSLFAVIARTKLGEYIFGWHGGVIEEKSPLSLRDFAKQRQRWFYGIVQNLKYFSLKEKVSQSLRAFVWSLGFFSGLVAVIVLVPLPELIQIIPDPIRIAFVLTTILWFCSYQIGAFFNSQYLPIRRRIWFHFLVFASSFFLGIVESATPLLALLKRPKTFEVVKKQ